MSSNIKSNTRTAKTRTNDKTRPARQTDAANSQQGRRDGGGGVLSSSNTKGHKDQFMKKIEKVSKTYDYKDETKDQKAKQERLTALSEL